MTMSQDDNFSGYKNKNPWSIVASREIYDLWIGGRAFILLIIYAVMMSVLTFLFATNEELKLLTPKDAIYLTLQISLAFSLFLGLVIGSNTISGERDQESLEMLLLTPTSYRSIILGKYLSALTPWPISMIISSAYLYILRPDLEIFLITIFWGTLLGTVVIVGFTGLGIIMSVISNSNRTSLSASMVLYILFLIPTQLPGTVQTGSLGIFLKRVNPLESLNVFLEKIIVNNRTPTEMSSWLLSPLIFTTGILLILFLYVSPNMKLQGRLQA
ncbi:MAG: ABC transporter permease [Candidatus Kariarchaeaceae archaeon]|jgi:ABC-2 type transport system permease protein